MICKDCAAEADGKFGPTGECGVCGREFAVTVNGFLPRHGSDIYSAGRRQKCSGSGLPAMRGHALCQGCDCHHKRKGDCVSAATAAAEG